MALTRRSFARGLTVAGAVASFHQHLQAQSTGLFRHGVASGDPTLNRVIIWTRVSPTVQEPMVTVEWLLADDPQMNRVLQRGLTSTNASFDYTVKVDVKRLDPGRTYYYQFLVGGQTSPIGRTKTLPADAANRLRFAVTSCSNLPFGFFNVYRAVANRRDLDLVLHLGDYIYEYGEGQYGTGAALGRAPQPSTEILSLSDYRQRYAQYRTDPDLQEVHRQHPFIVVWDDHESTNDSWRSGAQNHQANEGDWSQRRAVATQAWFEWLPVRENPFQNDEIYRSFRFGDLADIIMLDTRLAGRDQQVAGNSPLTQDPNRTLLGREQEAWFHTQLAASQNRGARWRIIGQQVMMGQLLNAEGAFLNPDQWDGYTPTRTRFLQQLATNNINNVVVLTGDIHSSWGNEISANPFSASASTRQAVEFVAPAVTSPGIPDPAQAATSAAQLLASHPHIKWVELNRRGYLLVDIDRDRAQAEWYHVRTITERSADESLARVLRAASGESTLTPSDTASAPVANPAPFAS